MRSGRRGWTAQWRAPTPEFASEVRVLADEAREGATLYLRNAHIEGPGPGKVGVKALFGLAKQYARQSGADRIVIEGAKRTTGGALEGTIPRPIVLDVKE